MMLETSHFLAKYDTDAATRTPVLIISGVSIAIGVYVSLFSHKVRSRVAAVLAASGRKAFHAYNHLQSKRVSRTRRTI